MIDAKDFPRTLVHKGFLLLHCESPIDSLFINANDWLFTHDAGRDWRPLGMSLSDSLLGNHREIQLLILTQHHQTDWVVLSAIVTLVLDWDHS